MLTKEAESNSRFIEIIREKYPMIFLYTIKNFGNSLKPFDILGCHNGRMIAIEGKFWRGVKRPSPQQIFNKLEPHQVLSLLKVAEAGGSPNVVAYYKGEFIKYNFSTSLLLQEVDQFDWENLDSTK